MLVGGTTGGLVGVLVGGTTGGLVGVLVGGTTTVGVVVPTLVVGVVVPTPVVGVVVPTLVVGVVVPGVRVGGSAVPVSVMLSGGAAVTAPNGVVSRKASRIPPPITIGTKRQNWSLMMVRSPIAQSTE